MPTEASFLGVSGAVWLAILLTAAVVVFARRMILLVRILALGRRENRLDHLGLRLSTFLREVMGQTRFLRGEPIIKWAHPLIFWGFCLFVIASALMFVGGIAAPWFHVPQIESIPVLGTFIDLFAVAVLVGLAAASIRRYVFTPPGLQRTVDATIVVSLIALLMVTFLLAEAGGYAKQLMAIDAGGAESGGEQTWLPAGTSLAQALLAIGIAKETLVDLGIGAWWLHAMVLLFFLVYLPYSKHMHLIWAPFAVFFAELPRKGMLPPAFEKAAGEPGSPFQQFTWRTLLNAYACAECGRCERVCPAAASGSQLSPRQIIHDLKGFVLKQGAAAVRGRGGNGQTEEFIGGVVESEAIWACATCHACVDLCPVRNEHVPLIVEMRRKLVDDGRIDPTLQDTLMSLQRYGNSFGQSARKRADWTKPLEFKVKDARKEEVEYLWFVGDYASYDQRAQEVTRTLAKLFHYAGIDFGLLFEKEQNAGNDVRRIGEEGLFSMLLEKNTKELADAKFRKLLATDPHTYNTLKNEYNGAIAGKPVLHYTEILDELLPQGKLRLVKPLECTATYHDPCYLGRYNGVYEAPRRVLRALGANLVEMPRNRQDSFCCGAGGGRIWMKDTPGIEERPAENRVKEALALPDVQCLVVACPKDLVMFQDAVKTVGAEDRLRVVELGELVFDVLGMPTEALAHAGMNHDRTG